jgi:Fe-S-cluster containining protein
MPRRIRIAILGACPCDQCTAACCKQNGHEYAAILRGDEIRKFAAFSVDAPIRDRERVVIEKVLPYVKERCQFLGDDDRCTIYEDRPQACRAFECLSSFNADGLGAHGTFLSRNPHVAQLLNALRTTDEHR